MNTKRSCDFANRGSFFQEPSGELQLLIAHLLRSSEANATLPGIDTSGTSALADEVTLEFGDSGEDSHNHLAGMRGGVGPRFGDGLEAGTGLANGFDDLKQVAGGTGQPVELPDGDDVSVAKLIEHSVQFGPVAVGSGDLFSKDFAASGLVKGLELKSQPLIFGRNAGVADFHEQAPTSFAKYIALGILYARYLRDVRMPHFAKSLRFSRNLGVLRQRDAA
jgi:hypothetical protein